MEFKKGDYVAATMSSDRKFAVGIHSGIGQKWNCYTFGNSSDLFGTGYCGSQRPATDEEIQYLKKVLFLNNKSYKNGELITIESEF